jgi:TolB-like protein
MTLASWRSGYGRRAWRPCLCSSRPRPFGRRRALPRASPSRGLRQRSVMVAPLENFTGDPALDPLGRMAADWVGQAAARHGIRVVPTAEILLDLATAGLAPAGDERARAAAARFHADLLVTGHYTRVGGDLVIRAQVSDLRSGNLWGPVPAIRAPADSPGLALERIEQRVAGLLASQLRPARAFELDSTFVRAALVAASAHWQPPTWRRAGPSRVWPPASPSTWGDPGWHSTW